MHVHLSGCVIVGRCVGKNVHMPYSDCMGCMGLDPGWNSCSAIWWLCNIAQLPWTLLKLSFMDRKMEVMAGPTVRVQAGPECKMPVHSGCSVSVLPTLPLLQVRWSCDSYSGLLSAKERGWAALSDSPPHHKHLIAEPEEEMSPHKLGKDWLWVPTSLRRWLPAGCVLCKLIFCILSYFSKMCIFDKLHL